MKTSGIRAVGRQCKVVQTYNCIRLSKLMISWTHWSPIAGLCISPWSRHKKILEKESGNLPEGLCPFIIQCWPSLLIGSLSNLMMWAIILTFSLWWNADKVDGRLRRQIRGKILNWTWQPSWPAGWKKGQKGGLKPRWQPLSWHVRFCRFCLTHWWHSKAYHHHQSNIQTKDWSKFWFRSCAN